MSKAKKAGWISSLNSLYHKLWRAATVLATVATVSFSLGYKMASVSREREIMRIENYYSSELLNLKDEYMEKYYQMKERFLLVNHQRDSITRDNGE